MKFTLVRRSSLCIEHLYMSPHTPHPVFVCRRDFCFRFNQFSALEQKIPSQSAARGKELLLLATWPAATATSAASAPATRPTAAAASVAHAAATETPIQASSAQTFCKKLENKFKLALLTTVCAKTN